MKTSTRISNIKKISHLSIGNGFKTGKSEKSVRNNKYSCVNNLYTYLNTVQGNPNHTNTVPGGGLIHITNYWNKIIFDSVVLL